jgi:glycosyltransferase involved in cell wall biosynthesis
MSVASKVKPKKIAVVIPCYNEAASIAQVIKKFPRRKLAKYSFSLNMYVVDNNSVDRTAKIAKRAGAKVVSELKKGKGHALRAGFGAVAEDVDYVVMLDGDDTYSPEEVLRMVEPLDSDFCDVVVGSRLGGRIQNSAMTTFNRLGNWLFTNAVRTVYRANVTDVLTGYFAWKKQALDGLYPHLKSDGFAIEMEMVTKMARLGYEMTSVPISYHPRAGESNLRPVRDGGRILKMFLKNLTWNFAPQPDNHPRPVARKIVFVSDGIYPYMKGGKEKRLHEISKHLASMGHDVHIYTMHWWKSAQKERTESGVHLHALCGYYDMYHGDRRSIKEGLIFGLACLKLFRVKFDVLDVDHMPFFPIFSSWIVCTLRRLRFYGTWHEALSRKDWVNYMGQSGLVASLIERISVRLPHTITAASLHTKDLLASVHGRVERVGLVASGIDTTLMSKIKAAKVACDVLYVGRLVKDKNIHHLIAAISIIAKDKPDVQCIIIGEGAEKLRLEQLARRLKMQKNITFLRPLKEATDVYAYMKAAKVFCLPSTREGFSLVTLEALGCGTPVVTVDSPANAARHFITNGGGSIVPSTAEDVAAAISHWIALPQKPDLAAEVAAYDWHSLAEKQIEVYSS